MPTDAVPPGFLQTIILQIAMHLLAACNGDLDQARKAASDTIARYAAETDLELRLVARIIGFSLQAGQALAQAADPARSLTHQIRLRSGAVSLSREADKAERHLRTLQQARRQGVSEPAPEKAQPGGRPSTPVTPAPAAAPMPAAPASPTAAPMAPPMTAPAAPPMAIPPAASAGPIAAYAKAHGLSYGQALQHRQRDQKLVARMMKAARAAVALGSANAQAAVTPVATQATVMPVTAQATVMPVAAQAAVMPVAPRAAGAAG